MGSKRANYFLFAACHRSEEKNIAKTNVISEEKSDIDANETYFYFSLKDSSLDIDNLFSFSKNNDDDQNSWEDVTSDFQKETQFL